MCKNTYHTKHKEFKDGIMTYRCKNCKIEFDNNNNSECVNCGSQNIIKKSVVKSCTKCLTPITHSAWETVTYRNKEVIAVSRGICHDCVNETEKDVNKLN